MSSAIPSIRQLKYLVVLSETLNFHRASEKLFITQSTLSSGIKELETVLGVTLVERTKRRVQLTKVGSEIVKRSKTIIAEVDDLVSLTDAFKSPLSGELRMGVIPTIAPFLLPSILPLITRDYPQLKLYLREDFSDRLVDQVRSGALDFALIALPYDVQEFDIKKLFKDEFWWVSKDNVSYKKIKEISLKDVDLSDLLLLEEGHCLRDHSIDACASSEPYQLNNPFEASSVFTLLQMLNNGIGFTLLPEMMIKAGALRGTELIARPIAGKTPFREICLIKRKTDANEKNFELLAKLFISNQKKSSNKLGASRSKR